MKEGMSSFIEFIVSVNKIALVAFVAVLGFLVYEVKRMRDEKRKHEQPTVPVLDLKKNPEPQKATYTPLPTFPKKESAFSPLLIVGILSFIIVIGVAIYFVRSQMNERKSTPIAPIITEISSAGLRIYDKSWNEYTDFKVKRPQDGEIVYIGIQTIQEADIDRARIKINEKDWKINDITTSFNPERQVYYREYMIATGTALLQISAQLHSASDGWLGD
jgi:heme/copper-type cytochrome/quinol oxidase subunit 2